MKKNIITISESGVVSVSGNIQMQDFEIAELFGVMIPTICSHVRAILKTGIATGDYTHGIIWICCKVLPNCYGLDMITALAFRVQSYKTKIFRKWIMRKMTIAECQPIILQYNYQAAYLSEQN